MNLTLKIDDKYLTAHTLNRLYRGSFSSDQCRTTLSEFERYAKNSYPEAHKTMTDLYNPAMTFFQSDLFEPIDKDLEDLRKSTQFKKVRSQVERYVDFLETQWERNRAKSTEVVQELTGFDLTDDEFTVFVTHPSLRNGLYLGQKRIAWGHNEDWENYSTVYLWHEILHHYLSYDDINHAIIQLITDNELRVRLNGGEYPPFVGHENLFELMEQLMPAWRDHLQSPDFDSFTERSKQLI